MNTLIPAAEAYIDLGFPVIPIAVKAKTPPMGFPFKKYESNLPSLQEVCNWSEKYPNSGIGIVTGQRSNLCVIDIDGDTGRRSIDGVLRPDCGAISRTARGWHIYCRRPDFSLGNHVGLMPGIDIRCDGGYVIAPPSIHKSGHRYEWIVEPSSDPLPLLPDSILNAIIAKRQTRRFPQTRKKHGMIFEGQRNQSVFLAACGFVRDSYSFEHLMRRVSGLNQKKCVPPLPDSEITKICANVCKTAGYSNLLPSKSHVTTSRHRSASYLTAYQKTDVYCLKDNNKEH